MSKSQEDFTKTARFFKWVLSYLEIESECR
jgi:hypothetical protein